MSFNAYCVVVATVRQLCSKHESFCPIHCTVFQIAGFLMWISLHLTKVALSFWCCLFWSTHLQKYSPFCDSFSLDKFWRSWCFTPSSCVRNAEKFPWCLPLSVRRFIRRATVIFGVREAVGSRLHSNWGCLEQTQ
jgi:hypothetical protein